MLRLMLVGLVVTQTGASRAPTRSTPSSFRPVSAEALYRAIIDKSVIARSLDGRIESGEFFVRPNGYQRVGHWSVSYATFYIRNSAICVQWRTNVECKMVRRGVNGRLYYLEHVGSQVEFLLLDIKDREERR